MSPPGENGRVPATRTGTPKTAGRPNVYPRRYLYPGQKRAIWQVLSDLRRRHWWREPEISDAEAEAVWLAFVGEGTQRAAMGRLVHELHEHGRLQRVDIERRYR